MTMDELYEHITKIIDAPYKTQIKAVQIFLAIDEYLIDALPGYVEGDNRFEFDFSKYTNKILDND